MERIEFEFAQSAHGADEVSGNCGGTEFPYGLFFFVRDHFGPGVRRIDDFAKFIGGYVFVQADRQSLAMAAHGSDPDADSIDGDLRLVISEDLIGFGLAFPFLAALAVAEIFIDPGYEPPASGTPKFSVGNSALRIV